MVKKHTMTNNHLVVDSVLTVRGSVIRIADKQGAVSGS